jgi:hypothetical protein
MIGLARAHLIIADPDRSCELVAEALPLVDPTRPGRVMRKLGDWSREVSSYSAVPAVRETREQVRELISAS